MLRVDLPTEAPVQLKHFFASPIAARSEKPREIFFQDSLPLTVKANGSRQGCFVISGGMAGSISDTFMFRSGFGCLKDERLQINIDGGGGLLSYRYGPQRW